MSTFIGIAIVIAGLICWAGQTLSYLAPGFATRFGLLEQKEEMDETLYIIEAKALCLNDMLLTWTLPLSGVLLLLDNPFWPYLGLIGGGIYLYFSGLIVFSRIYLGHEGKKVGALSNVRVAYVFALVWVLASVSMIMLSYAKLSQPH